MSSDWQRIVTRLFNAAFRTNAEILRTSCKIRFEKLKAAVADEIFRDDGL